MYRLKKRFKNEKGQGLVEYGLILALVSIVAILGLSTLGGNIKGQFEGITDSMDISEPRKYSDEEIDNLIVEGYIPVATADELNNVRSGAELTYGKGTKWVGEYEGGLDKQYIQVADIDLSGIDDFEPIGRYYGSVFTGTFDGGDYVISNLKINRISESYVGLFGRVKGATFKNVGLEDVNVTGRRYTGGLVGHQDSSSVTNSYATGSVTGTEDYVGGLVGRQEYSSTVRNSYATGSVNGGNDTGGLVGSQYSSSTVSNSYATGNVTGENATGGLVGGHGNSSTVSNSYATGSVTGGDSTGGLVGGHGFNSSVTDSYYDKETTGRADTGKGTGKPTAEMKNKNTYTNWDNTIWEFKDGQYPTLR